MNVNIVHEKDGYVMYVDGEFYGIYDSPVQAAQAFDEMNEEEKKQNGSV